MLKKYKITEERHPKNPKIGRIEALIDFGDVKKGDKGGFILIVGSRICMI